MEAQEVVTRRKEKEAPKVAELFAVSDFKLGDKEKVAGAETRIVEYTMLKTKAKPKDEKWVAKVWINTKTYLPAKLEQKVFDFDIKVSETYTEFVIDGKLDSKLFEIPK